MKFSLALALFLVFISKSFANKKLHLLDKIEVSCELANYCEDYEKKFNSLLGKKYNSNLIREKIRFILFDMSIERLSYRVFQKENRLKLKVDIRQRKRIRNITLISNGGEDFSSLKRFLPYREGDFFQNRLNDEANQSIKKSLKDRGYINNKVSLETINDDLNIDLVFNIDPGAVGRVQGIEVIGGPDSKRKSLEKKFQQFKKEIWDKVAFKVKVDQVAKELFDSGYFSSKLDFEVNNVSNNEQDVKIKLKVHYGKKLNFSFIGNKIYNHYELLSTLRDSIKRSGGDYTESELVKSIQDKYQEKGFYKTDITFYSKEGISINRDYFKNYYFTVKEGHKIKIESLDFIGNNQLTTEFIEGLYNEKSTDLAGRGLLDEGYLTKFTSTLKKEYLRKGFVFAEIVKPNVIFVDDKRAVVEFKIQERQQSILKKINFLNVPTDLSIKLRKSLQNKEGKPINIVALEDDLNKLLEVAREEGYYYASVLNLDNTGFLKYSSNYSEVTLNFNFNLQKISRRGDLLVTGNAKTRLDVITREIPLKEGDLITPSKIEEIRTNLNSLNLFSQVRISPIIVNRNSKDKDYRVNIIIRVSEKEFRFAELAPGFRTDLGAKVSLEVLWKNLQGMNRTVSMKAQTNYRFNLNSLDVRRKTEDKKLIEGSFDLSYNEPYLFGAKYGFNTSLAYQRRRFFSFDANIFRITPKVTKSFNKYLSTTLKYQWEFVDQFDATDVRDDGKFRIGSITPSITLDFRSDDNPLKTINGALFNLSWEFANPALFSEKDDELEVNYYRLVSRNNFYLAFTDNFMLAMSYTFGFEKNLANTQKRDAQGNLLFNADGSPDTEGFIPSIKVFRLDGFNTVRGFADSEINRLDSEIDISQVTVTDQAYFANLKIEPRYFLSDNTMLALFFDAGRVFVDHFKPLDLRTSAGLSFKFLTPVGSLDFDYGVKLRRRRLSTGSREGFGRFHLTIGFF